MKNFAYRHYFSHAARALHMGTRRHIRFDPAVLARKGVATLLSGLLVFQPMLIQAQVAPDINAPIGNQPGIGAAPNGVPLVDIVTPNGQGLSHNKYHDFNVGNPGLILNNHNGELGTSKLGGVTPGNPNLKNSGPATVILNEVTSGNRSALQGATEVFGGRADVIIANPNGITCDGCGFINTPRATLTTGTPDIDGTGRLSGFTVQGGDVTFGSKGGNFASGDGAVDLFDIVSRRVQIDGPVNGKTLRLSAGRQKFNYATGEATALDGADDAGEFAIDGSALGAMQADRIKIVVTDKGAGVRMRNDMAAHAGELTLSADGKISLGNASGRDGVSIQSKSKQVEAKKVTSKKRVIVKAAKGITLEAVAADEDVILNTDTGLLSIAGDAASLGNIELTSSGAIVTGNVAAGQNAKLQSGQGITAGSVVADGAATLATTSGNIALSGTAKAGGGALNITATSGSISAASLVSFNNMALTAGSDIATGDILSGGALVASARSLKATSAVSGMDFAATTTGGAIKLGTAGDMRLQMSGGAIDVGTLLSAGNLVGDAATFKATNVTSHGTVNLSGATTISGQLLSGSDITIKGAFIDLGTAVAGVDLAALEESNVVLANTAHALNLTATAGNLTAQRLLSAGDTVASATGNLSANATAHGDLNLTAGGTLTLSGQSLAGGNATLNAGSINLGTLVSGVDFAATEQSGGSLILKTGVSGTGKMALNASSGSITADQLLSGGDLTAKAQQNISYNSLQSFGAADLNAVLGAISLDKNTVAKGDITLALQSLDLSNDRSKLATAGTLIVHAASANLANSTLTFGGIALNLTGSADASGTKLRAVTADGGSGNIAIAATTVTTTAATAILAANDLTLTLASLTNSGQLAANNNLTFTLTGDLTNTATGLVYAGRDGRLFVNGNILNDQGAILSGNDLAFANAAGNGKNGSLVNRAGLIQSGRDLSVLTSYLKNEANGDPVVGERQENGQRYSFGQPEHAEELWDNDTLMRGRLFYDPSEDVKWGRGGCRYKNGDPCDVTWLDKGLWNTKEETYGYVTLPDGTIYKAFTWTKAGSNDGKGKIWFDWNADAAIAEQYQSQYFVSKPSAQGLIQAGGNLTIDATTIDNLYSSIEAGGDAAITSDHLTNKGITLYRDAYMTCLAGAETCYGYNADGSRNASADISAGSSILIGHEATDSLSSTIRSGGALTLNVGKLDNSAADGSIAGYSHYEAKPSTGDPLAALGGLTAGGALYTPAFDLDKLTGPNADPALLENIRAGIGLPAPKPNSGGFGGTVPGQVFIYETRAEFLDVSKFYGSGYFLSRVGYQPDHQILFLGDAYFENQLIDKQMREAMGYGLNRSGADPVERMKSLLDNGIDYAQSHGLAFGEPLSPEQIAALDQSIVVYVKQNIGGVEVFAPVLYVSPKDKGDAVASASMIEGNIVTVSGDTINNSGLIASNTSLNVQATSITANGGGFAAKGDLTLAASGNIALNAGTTSFNGQTVVVPTDAVTAGGNAAIQSGQTVALNGVNVTAGQNLAVSGENVNIGTATGVSADGSQTVTGSKLQSGADTNITAKHDITVSGSSVAAGGDLGLKAESGNLTIQSAEATRKDGFGETTTQQKSALSSGGATNLKADKNIVIAGSDVKAGGDLAINAGEGVAVIATQDHASGSFGSNSFVTTTQQGSNLSSGGDTSLTAGADILIGGSSIDAGRNLNLDAKGDVNIVAMASTNEEQTNGRIFKRTESETTAVGSSLKAGGDLSATAGNDLNIIGSKLEADGKAALSAGNDVNILAAENTHDLDSSFSEKSSGPFGKKRSWTKNEHDTEAVGSSISGKDGVDIASGNNTTIAASKVQAGTEDHKADLNIDAGGDLIVASGKDVSEHDGSKSKSGFLSKKSDKNHTYDETTVASELSASGNVNLNADRQVAISGSKVTAGDNIAIEGDSVSIIGAQERHESASSSKKSGLGVGSGDGFYSIYGKKEKSQSEAITANVGSELSAGNDVSIKARETDVNIVGSKVEAGNDIALDAARDVNILPGAESYASEEKEKRSGIGIQVKSGNGSASIGVGYGSAKTESSQGAEVNAVSSLSAGRDVIITAGRDANLQAAQVEAGSTVDILAERDVNLLSAQDKTNYEYMHQELFAGVTATVSSQAAAAVGNAYDAAKKVGDGNTANSIAMATIAGINGKYIYDSLTSGQNGPLVSGSIGVGFEYSKNSAEGSASIPVPTTIRAGDTVIIEAGRDINAVGAQISAGYDQFGLPTSGRGDIALIAGNDINLESAKATTENSSKNLSVGASVNIDLSGGNFNYGQGKGNDKTVTNVNTHVAGSGTVYVNSGNDTNLRGATVSGETVIADIGGNLNIESQLDTATAKAKQVNISGGVGTNAQGQTSGGISGSYQTAKGDAAIVSEQSGIHAGEGGFDIKVDGNTKLKGGLITSEADPKDNRLETGTLEFEDLDTHSKWKADTYGGGITGSGPIVSPPIKEGESETGKALSAISPGEIIITDPDNQEQNIDDLRRDTADTNTSLPGIPDLQKLLSEQLKTQQLYDDAAAKAAKMIGDYAQERYRQARENDDTAEMEFWKEGGNGPAILHAIAGGLLGGVTDFNGMLSGMLGGAMSAKLAPEIHKLVEQFVKDAGLTGSAADLMVKSITGSILQGLGAATGGTGAAYAGNAYQNNYLNHAEQLTKLKAEKALEDCQDKPGSCSEGEVKKLNDEVERLTQLDNLRDIQLILACSYRGQWECAQHLQSSYRALQSYLDAQEKFDSAEAYTNALGVDPNRMVQELVQIDKLRQEVKKVISRRDAQQIQSIINGLGIGAGGGVLAAGGYIFATEAIPAVVACTQNLACFNELGASLAEAAAGDALAGSTLVAAAGNIILRKGDQIVSVIDTATGVRKSIDEFILSIPKGQRPNPSAYLSQAEINAQLALFDDGAVRFTTRSAIDQYGTAGSSEAFVMPKVEFDKIVAESGGNLSIIEQRLGLDVGSLSDGDTIAVYVKRQDMPDLRVPSGNEVGVNSQWQPGGRTVGGVSEAVTNLTGAPFTEIPF